MFETTSNSTVLYQVDRLGKQQEDTWFNTKRTGSIPKEGGGAGGGDYRKGGCVEWFSCYSLRKIYEKKVKAPLNT